MRYQIFILSCMVAIGLQAQFAPYKLFTIADGLPQTELAKLHVDSKGRLWITSQSGWLSSFDGASFTNYSPEEIGWTTRGHHFHEDTSGLWLSSPLHTLSFFDGNQWHPINNDLGLQCFGPHHKWGTIGIDSMGKVFTYTKSGWSKVAQLKIPASYIDSEAFYFIHDVTTKSYLLVVQNNYQNTTFLVKDFKSGNLQEVYTGGRGIELAHDWAYFRTGEREFSRLVWDTLGKVEDKEVVYQGSVDHITSIDPLTTLIPQDDRLTISIFDQNLEEIRSVQIETSAKWLRSAVDHDGNIWLCSQVGLLKIQPDLKVYFDDNPNMVTGLHMILEDSSDNIWFGGYEDGFSILTEDRLSKIPVKEGIKILPGGCTDRNGKSYLFLERNGLTILSKDGLDNRFSGENMYDGLPLRGYIIKELNQDRLALGTQRYGLALLDLPLTSAKKKLIHKEKGLDLDNILCIAEDEKGRIWMGRSSQGVAVYDPVLDTAVTWRIDPENSSSFGAMSLEIDHRGNLWMGTNKGLFFLKDPSEFDVLSNSVVDEAIPIGSQEIGSSLVTLLKCHKGYLFYGNLHGHGFVDLKSYYTNPGEPRIRFNKTTDQSLGGASEQNAVLIDKQDRLWIGKDRGAVCINWKSLVKEYGPVDLEIKNVTIGDSSISKDIHDKFRLPRNKRNINIQVGHRFDGRLENRVRYGYSKIYNGDTTSWKPVNERSVLLQDLRPGHHSVLVRAVVDNQIKDEESISIHVPYSLGEHPFFWSIIAGLGSLILVIIGFLVWRNRMMEVRNLRTRAKLQGQLDHMKAQLITSSLNPHFINNSLHWIQSQLLEKPEAVQVAGRLSENIRTIFQHTRLGINHHSLASELKLVENYLLIQKARYGEEIKYHLPQKDNWALWEGLEVPIMQIQIHVENAIEHGLRNKEDAGTLWVSIETLDDGIQILIEDDGIGRQKAKTLGSSGTQQGTRMLKELHELLNKHNSQKIESKYEDLPFKDEAGKGFGTRVEIFIPKDFRYDFAAT